MKIKKLLCFLVVLAMMTTLTAATVFAAGTRYADVPADSWAAQIIEKASSYGLMNGQGGGAFGYGRTITRAEFVTVLVRMFGWSAPGGDDAAPDITLSWARTYINAAAAHDVFDTGALFRPNEPITRAEMAVMLVRALGLKEDGEAGDGGSLPFTDVTGNKGYIAVAYDIGMVDGMTATTFEPDGTALREQAAAMLVRVYEKYHQATAWTHAFYAISSYSQLEEAKKFDAVSLGWSRMTYDAAAGAALSTTSEGGNEYAVPSGYAQVVTALQAAGVKLHLSVFMEGSALKAMLADSAASAQAADAILAELARSYDGLSGNPYTGVTIDFEGLSGETQKAEFTAFLTALSAGLKAAGKTLYVAVMPATADGDYFDGYDFRAIGRTADKVILMAHDYAAHDLTGFLGTKYYMNTALTPLYAVYYALRAAVDPKTGVEDRTKLVLAVSLENLAWETDENGGLTSASPLSPTAETVYKRLKGGAEMGWSDKFRNAYLKYVTEDGQHIFLWYEDARSVAAKLSAAKLLGVTSVSVWRLGIIPDYADEGLYFNVMDALK